MKKILALLVCVLMLGSLVVGCSTPAAETPATEAPAEEAAPAEDAAEAPAEEAAEEPVETVSLNVGYMPNYGSLWSVVTAIDKGYFAEENLEVTLTEFGDGPTIISAMESGSINFGYIGQGAHKLCVQGNATIIATSPMATL